MINVVPVDDIEEHEDGANCHCNPVLLVENNEVIVLHRAFDCRELLENINLN